jgi:hypothetical protein
MKNLMIYLTLVMLVGQPFIGIAEVTIAATVSGKTITLSFQETSQSVSQNALLSLDRQKVVLKDKAGYILYQESVSTNYTPEKNYNLKELPNGEYVFVIYDKLKVTLKPFTIVGDKIALMDETRIFKPTTTLRDNVVIFNLLAFRKPVNVIIMDAYGEELYSEVFENKNSIGKRFDFSTAPNGTYTITTVVENQYFTEDIKI